MADILCPNCGKNNPDFLDHCQFCQSPLKPESTLHAGESPTKKNTGELKSILPEWLREVQEQARQSAEENATHEAARPKIQKDESPDLLAGLASQAGADDDAIPDWLANINPVPGKPTEEPESSLTQEDRQSLIGGPEEKDELSEWFSQASEQPGEPFVLEPGQDEPDLMNRLDSSPAPLGGSAAPKEEEDLGWLRDLEASAKEFSEPSAPRQDLGRIPDTPSSQPSSGEQDLSWLNNLGGISEPSGAPSVHEPDSGSDESGDKPAAGEPFAPQEDLSWLDKLGRTSEPSRPESAQPSPEQDLGWLSEMGEKADVANSESQVLSPRGTAPLSKDAQDESIPDWLKSATEEPSMPPLGAGALDWFASHDLDEGRPAAAQGPSSDEFSGEDEKPAALPFKEAEELPGLPTPASEPIPATNQEVDSLFSMDVPDWLSNPEQGARDIPSQEVERSPSIDAESLAPVDLPSWVQAMRPVEAVISDTASRTEDQAPEQEGPLAGLSGVLPLLPIGSSRRPKALSLTLQATDEQQAGAALLEEILARETAPRTQETPSSVTSQSVLRWILTGIVMLMLGAMIALRSQSMPISTALPVEVGAASSAMTSIPESATVLVVVDYEASRAAELEAVSGPLLNQMILTRRSNLSFLSTSPNGPALVERLITNTRMNIEGGQYLNLGYLPGGSAGVLAFIESPQTAIPAAEAETFSQYAAVLLLTDHAESARVWVEQLDARRQSDASLASQPLLVVASAQAGPLLQPYVSSGQVTGMISGLPDAARYEFANNVPPGIARTYWDAFGIGLLLAIILITFGSLWSLIRRLSPRRTGVE
ncbi:MAG TPA: hypothetical protein VJ821_12140 [Anaerolineales bacterium]|nr:hypothetical protein [Anaerolineales bacterium]